LIVCIVSEFRRKPVCCPAADVAVHHYIIVQVFNLEMAAFSRREKEIRRATPSSATATTPASATTTTPPSSATSSAAATTTTDAVTAAAATTATDVDLVPVGSTVSETVSPQVQSAAAG